LNQPKDSNGMSASQTPSTVPERLRKVGAEMVGTFALVFAGCGAIAVASAQPDIMGHGAVCAVFGLVIMVMIFATGHISGAHFNPGVTLAFAVIRRFSWREVPLYICGQVLAATAAAFLLRYLLGPEADLGVTRPVATLTLLQAAVIEVILTGFLMFVITAVATDSRAEGHLAGLAIGGTVAFCALMGGPLTGASMNPARSWGPALASGQWDLHWLYWVAPVVGASLGALLYQWIRCDRPTTPPTDTTGCC